MTFKQELVEMFACKKAIKWVGDRTLEQAWSECPRGDWMLWLLEKMEKRKGWLDEKETILLGCWCTRRVLKYIPKGEIKSLKPLKTIEAKEKWARGEGTRKEIKITIATAMNDIMNVAKTAAIMDTAISVAIAAASFAATNAAWAAARAAATNAVNSAAKVAASPARISTLMNTARDKESKIQADYIRTQFTPPKGNLCLSNND